MRAIDKANFILCEQEIGHLLASIIEVVVGKICVYVEVLRIVGRMQAIWRIGVDRFSIGFGFV